MRGVEGPDRKKALTVGRKTRIGRVIPAGGGKAKRLTSDLSFGGAAVLMPDGKYIVCPFQRGGSMTLWRVSISGGEPEPILSGAGQDREPDISRDGSEIYRPRGA